MNNYYALDVLAKEKRADLLREADQARLWKAAQGESSGKRLDFSAAGGRFARLAGRLSGLSFPVRFNRKRARSPG